MSKVFRSLDDNALALKMRENVLSALGFNPQKFDNYITCGQIVNFLEKYRSAEGYIELDYDQLTELLEFVHNTALSVTLAKMAAEGLVESRWDDELNEMVFKLPDSMLEGSEDE